MQKLYCYVDESGQDAGSEFFVVAAIVSEQEQEKLRDSILQVEKITKSGGKKWHKLRSENRVKHLNIILDQKIGKSDVCFGCFKKPIPYSFPIIEVVEKSIKRKVKRKYSAIVYIDGIDRKKAAELTNALRMRGVSLRFIKSRRDESEPLIRLADMWAGCIRGALLGKRENIKILARAKKEKYLYDVAK